MLFPKLLQKVQFNSLVVNIAKIFSIFTMADLYKEIRSIAFPKDDPNKYTIEQARTLTWTRILEVEALEKGAITPEETSECTQVAQRQLGENASLKSFLLTRADLIQELIGRKDPRLLNPRPVPIKIWWASLIIAVIAFLFGLITEDIATSDNRINLLSPPLLALYAWNLFVYLWIFCDYVFEKIRGKAPFEGPIRRGLKTLMTYTQTWSMRKSPALARFYKSWIPVEAPILWKMVAGTLHLGAMCLGIGIVVSIGFRGWGTLYLAGWESTWLANSPDFVLGFLKVVYGAFPAGDALFDKLDIETIKAMRFVGTHGGVPAAAWMVRLITATTAIIILPRLLLFGWNKARAEVMEKDFPINLQTPYFQNLVRQKNGQVVTIYVLPYGKGLDEVEKSGLRDLANVVSLTGADFVYEPVAREDTPIPQFKATGAEEVWIVFPMAATPETEVHVAFVKDVAAACTKVNATLRILINTDVFEERYSGYSRRIIERRKNWSDALDPVEIPYMFVNLAKLDSEKAASEFESAATAD